jgi:D-alanine--poly(phosphoribitol) ligase subunit 1
MRSLIFFSVCFSIFADISGSMFKRIRRSFEEFAGENAFCINSTYYTYQDFGKRVNGIIAEINPDTSQHIGIVVYNDIETYASVLAVLFAGKTYIPLAPNNPQERTSKIIEQAEIETILTSHIDHVDNVIADTKFIRKISTKNILSETYVPNIPNVSSEQNAYILFTSGSTGIPKGVPIRYQNLGAFVDAFFSLGYDINERDRFLQLFDLTFDLSIMSYLIPLCVGASVFTVPSGEIKFTAAYSILEEQNISVALMVPSILVFLRKYFGEIRLEHMRYSLFCGEALYSDLTRQWSECVPNALVQNVYGPTEATIFCLTYDWKKTDNNKDYNGIVCIGKPMKNMHAIIVDENLAEAPVGSFGELCLAGDQLTSGYLKNPPKNKDTFFKHFIDHKEYDFYRTGDICCMDDDGDFLYSGRLDHQVKIQGFRVELSEVEFYAREFIGNLSAAAVTSQNATGNTLIHLFVEDFRNTSELNEYLKSKLPPYMIPAEIQSLKKFPLNSNGKTDRTALQKMIIQ